MVFKNSEELTVNASDSLKYQGFKQYFRDLVDTKTALTN